MCNYGFTRRGVMNDAPLHGRNERRRASMFDWEFFLGDKAYVGCDDAVTEYKKPVGAELTQKQKDWNKLVQHTRGSVGESAVAQLKNGRKALHSRWRGSLSFLAAVVHMTHLGEHDGAGGVDEGAAVRLNCGPWPVAPAQVVRTFHK